VDSAEDRPTRMAAITAAKAGAAAAKAGQKAEDCPHRKDADTFMERYLYRNWMLGFNGSGVPTEGSARP